jgi:hypothetical protein
VAATVGLATGAAPSVGVAGKPVASIAKGVTVAAGGGVEVGDVQAARRRVRRSRRRKRGVCGCASVRVWGWLAQSLSHSHTHTLTNLF